MDIALPLTRLLSPANIPIRWRVALFVMAVVGVFVFVGAILGGRVWEHELRQGLDEHIRSEIQEIQTVAPTLKTEEELVQFVDLFFLMEAGHHPNKPFVMRLADGSWLIPPGSIMGDEAFLEKFPPPETGEITFSSLEFPGGDSYRMASGSVVANGRELGTIYFAGPLGPLEALLGEHTRNILLGAIGAVALAGAGGYFIAGRALSPVRKLTRTAESISQEDLSRRLDYATPRDEVGELARALNGMIERLDRAFAAQRRLMADLSHQLRTPITVIRGHLDLLSRANGLSRRDRQESLKAGIEEADRMNRLVGNLLLLSRTTSRNFFQPRPLPLSPFLQEVLAKAQVLGPRRWVLGDLPDCTLVADADQLTGALLNLLQNAVQHTQAEDSIGLDAVLDDGWIDIKVWDTGEGIPADHLPSIFERFRRGPVSKEEDGQGTGLGLTIAQAVVQAHGGKLEVDSRLGEGSVFTVRLPLKA